MKQFKILSQIVAILLLFSCDKKTQNHPPADIRLSNKIEVIDFHSTRRCMTCNAIESSTIYTLNNYFPEEMKSGTISFRTINVDEKENYKIAEKYEASGTSLFLNVVIDGKETQINLTDFAFFYAKDQEVFSEKLMEMLKKYLSNM